MEGFLQNFSLGFQIAFTCWNLFYCFLGTFIGTAIGVLPGIGPVGSISLLLPVTFGMPPVSAIIMLAGIYYGVMYGGSTTSILVNIPGEAASVVTCLDGYKMARQGRAGPALGIAALGSFIAGTIGIILLMFLAKPLSGMAIDFGPAEYFALMILALSILTYLAQGSMTKALISAALGLAISQIGMDVVTGTTRFTLGINNLEDGVGLVPLVMGLFGIGEVLANVNESEDFEIYKGKIKDLLPNWNDWKDSIGPITRGTFLGFFLGILPGGGAVISSFASYAVEKKWSKTPEKFGNGAIEGVAGPESANNSATAGGFIPLFTLGIPSNAVMALLLAALMVHGMQPGPLLISQHPEIFWGTIASMYAGNVMLLFLNLPLIGIWVKLLKVPYRVLSPLILFICIVGSYSINNSTFDVFLLIIFGVLGYLFKQYKYEPAPLIMAFILGPMLENSLRQSLLMSQGELSIFFTRKISLACLVLALLLMILPLIWSRQRQIISKIK